MIKSLKYTGASQSSIQVTNEDGSVYTAPWPCYTWHAAEIQAAIDSGMSIELWKTEEEVLAETVDSVVTAIKEKRDYRQQNGGVLVAIDATTSKWFHSNDSSRIQQFSISVNGIEAGVMWKTMDGTYVEMTQDLAKAIVAATTVLDIATFGHAASMISEVEALTTAEAVLAYDYQSGWPAIYGE